MSPQHAILHGAIPIRMPLAQQSKQGGRLQSRIGFELFHPKASLLRKDWSELANHVGDGSAESNTPACSYLRAVPSLMPVRAAACFLSHPKSLVPQKSFSCKK
jgi:hypothetical protein